MILHFLLVNLFKPNHYCIAWQQEAFASTWTLIKTEFMCFNQDDVISSLNGKLVKFVNQLVDLGSNISLTENSVNIYIGKAWTAIDRLSALPKI